MQKKGTVTVPPELVCWKCGASLLGLPLPLSRLAECPRCRAYQHACRLCRFYDVRHARRCREERAEEVRDPEAANFCDWFEPAVRDPAVQSDKSQRSRAAVESLFGAAAEAACTETDPARTAVDALFKSGPKTDR
jgi:hypothetical protein